MFVLIIYSLTLDFWFLVGLGSVLAIVAILS